MGNPILCLDFDGVLHSYESGWQGADVVADPPVEGAVRFIIGALHAFEVHVFSSRSNQSGGIQAMKDWLENHLQDELLSGGREALPQGLALKSAHEIVNEVICWPTEKPPAMVTIDDRAIRFDGTWPSLTSLVGFKPWNRR